MPAAGCCWPPRVGHLPPAAYSWETGDTPYPPGLRIDHLLGVGSSSQEAGLEPWLPPPRLPPAIRGPPDVIVMAITPDYLRLLGRDIGGRHGHGDVVRPHNPPKGYRGSCLMSGCRRTATVLWDRFSQCIEYQFLCARHSCELWGYIVRAHLSAYTTKSRDSPFGPVRQAVSPLPPPPPH